MVKIVMSIDFSENDLGPTTQYIVAHPLIYLYLPFNLYSPISEHIFCMDSKLASLGSSNFSIIHFFGIGDYAKVIIHVQHW